MSGPPVVHYCVSCRHPAHGGRVCGARTFFTRTCGCRLSTELPDPPDHDDLPDARFYHGEDMPDFDERKAYREHDEGWYPDDRD